MHRSRFYRQFLRQFRIFARAQNTRLFTAFTGITAPPTCYAWSLWSKTPADIDEAPKPLRKSNDDIVIAQADSLYKAYIIDKLYEYLRPHRVSNNPELLWRCARASFEKGKLAKTGSAEHLRCTYEAYDFIKLAKSKESVDKCIGSLHKWYAIILDAVGQHEGNKFRIQHSMEVKEHFEKACSLDPTDATSRHLIGVWCYSFANMPSYQRSLAGLIFATPPSSTYQEALSHFLAAEMISPDFYSMNHLYLGLCYMHLAEPEKGVEEFKRAYRMPVISADDMKAKQEAEKELNRVGKFKEMLIQEYGTNPR